MSTRKNKQTWVIVLFCESKDYSVVPTNWLVQNNIFNLSNCNIEYCYWPDGRVTSTELLDAKDPEQSWGTYKIKLIGGNKTYDNFKKAWHTRVEKESESEQVELPSKCKESYYGLTDSSNDEEYSVMPLQQSQNKKRKTYTDLHAQQTTNYPIFCNEIDNQSYLPFLNISDKLYSKCILNLSKTIINVTKEKDRYFICKDNSLVTIQHIIKPQNKPIQFMVKKFMNVSKFSDKPISSSIVGIYEVDTNELCDLYLIHTIDLKYKCFFIQVSNCKAIVLSLCHEIL